MGIAGLVLLAGCAGTPERPGAASAGGVPGGTPAGLARSVELAKTGRAPVCRHERVVGSRIPRLVCLSPAELELERARTAEFVDALGRGGRARR